jgi:hypothetical protein
MNLGAPEKVRLSHPAGCGQYPQELAAATGGEAFLTSSGAVDIA